MKTIFTSLSRRAAYLTVASFLILPAYMTHAATLVGQWGFDGNLEDSSPTGADGTLYDLVHLDGGSKTETATTPTYATGVDGQALSIDSSVTPGTPDTYTGQVMRAGEHAAYDFGTSTDFSLAGHVYWGGDNDMAYQTILAQKQSRGSSREGFMVSIEPSGTVTLRLADKDANSFSLSSTSIEVNTWYHFAATVDRDGNAQMYINGVADGVPDSVVGVGDISSTGVDLTVGASGFANQKGYFNGQLDDIRVYNGLLTPTEIASLAVIPEPGTLTLLGVGMLAILMGARFRSKR